MPGNARLRSKSLGEEGKETSQVCIFSMEQSMCFGYSLQRSMRTGGTMVGTAIGVKTAAQECFDHAG
jgi:hypothetical protein